MTHFVHKIDYSGACGKNKFSFYILRAPPYPPTLNETMGWPVLLTGSRLVSALGSCWHASGRAVALAGGFLFNVSSYMSELMV